MSRIEYIAEIAKELNNNESFKNILAQAKARYILFSVGEDKVNFPAFTPKLTEKVDYLAYLHLEVGCTFHSDGKYDNAQQYFEIAANLIEYNHVPGANESEYSRFHILVGSLAYYCASQYSKSFILLSKFKYDTLLSKMVNSFLRKHFSDLDNVVKRVLVDGGEVDQKEFCGVYLILMARALSHLLNFLYYGNDQDLERAKIILQDATNVALLDHDPALWWVFRLMCILVAGYQSSSLWSNLLSNSAFKTHTSELEGFFELLGASDTTFWDNSQAKICKYIYSLAFRDKNPIVELFISQRKALNKVLDDGGAVVSMPTSSGKTRIAEMTILQVLMTNEYVKVLYIAPYRSLAYEIEESLSLTFYPLNCRVTHLYGGTQYTSIDRQEVQSARILIATPEKAKAILRANDDVIHTIKLVILDEGHLIGSSERDIVNEMFTEELRRIVKQNNGKFLVLSAVLPNVSDISNWLTGKGEQAIECAWRPSSQRLGILDYYGTRVDLRWKGEVESFNNSFVRDVTEKKEAVAKVAIKLSSLGSVLIYVPQTRQVLSNARVMYSLLSKQPDVEWGNDIDWKRFELICLEEEGDKKYLDFAKKGILCHSSILRLEVRNYMERLLRKGKARFIYATNTLAQGVNLGVSTVIIMGVTQGKAQNLNIRDFWNMAGRAGRAFVDTEGKILFVCDNTSNVDEHRRQADHYLNEQILDNVQSGLLQILKELYSLSEECKIDFDHLLGLIAENNFSELGSTIKENVGEKLDLIDDSLLALDLVYRQDAEFSLNWVDEHFRNSLAMIQERNESLRSKYIEILKARVHAVRFLSSQSKFPQAFASSGIPLRSAIYLDQRMNDIEILIKGYIDSERTLNDLVTFIKQFEQIVEEMPSLKDENITAEILDRIRAPWLSGNILPSDIKNVYGIANKYYCYTLSWILSAIASRYALAENEEYKQFFEEMSLLVSYGVPSKWAVQIYLCGIHSRQTATELSTILPLPYEMQNLYEVANYLKQEAGKIYDCPSCTQRTKEWIQLLVQSKPTVVKSIRKFPSLSFQESNIKEMPNLLYCKSLGDRIYLCNVDYQYRKLVEDSDEFEFSKVADVPGIYFQKRDGCWNMINVNPYIIVS